MPGIISDAWDWATTSPEFVKKRAKRAHESVESPSVFDSTAEKFGKPAIHAAIDTADTFATPADAAGLLVGGAGFAGAEIANRLRRLGKVGNVEHYLDARKLGKTHAEAIKIGSSGGKTAADRQRMVDALESQFGKRGQQRALPPVKMTPRPSSGPIRSTAGKGKSVIDLAESVRQNARRPYRQVNYDDWLEEYRKTDPTGFKRAFPER